MANLVNATYFANYNDYNGCDEVPCVVDLDEMEVVQFMPAIACRWYEDSEKMCVEENVQLKNGESFAAIKTDEYADALEGGYEDEYDRSNIILFDGDALEDACSDFAEVAHEDAANGFDFATCSVCGTPTTISNMATVSLDIHDAAEHLKRAVRTMKRNKEQVEGYNVRWPGFYDEYLEKAADMLAVLEQRQCEMEELEMLIRQMG